MSGLRMWTDGDAWVIATTIEQAIEFLAAEYGGGVADQHAAEEWDEIEGSKTLTYDDGDGVVTMTAAEWCGRRGPGYFCSENY